MSAPGGATDAGGAAVVAARPPGPSSSTRPASSTGCRHGHAPAGAGRGRRRSTSAVESAFGAPALRRGRRRHQRPGQRRRDHPHRRSGRGRCGRLRGRLGRPLQPQGGPGLGRVAPPPPGRAGHRHPRRRSTEIGPAGSTADPAGDQPPRRRRLPGGVDLTPDRRPWSSATRPTASRPTCSARPRVADRADGRATESLNVAATAAVLCFEVARQRRTATPSVAAAGVGPADRPSLFDWRDRGASPHPSARLGAAVRHPPDSTTPPIWPPSPPAVRVGRSRCHRAPRRPRT